MTKRKPKHLLKKNGRKTRYKKEFDEMARKCCLLGATDKELSSLFNISEKTLNTWKQKHPSFLQSLKEGKEIPDQKVVESLLTRALGYDRAQTKEVLSYGKMISLSDTTHYPADVKAIIYWLNNRQRGKWQSVNHIEQSVDNNLTIQREIIGDVKSDIKPDTKEPESRDTSAD